MRIYRVHMTYDYGSSAGYAYYSSEAEAQTAADAWKEEHEEECSIRAIEVEPTECSIITALNRYASHPNNG